MKRKPKAQQETSPTPSTWALSEREIAEFKEQSDRTMQQMRENLLRAAAKH